MSDFEGYEIKEGVMEESILTEGRPRLIPCEIKKNAKKWTIKNLETNKVYYMVQDAVNPNINMHDFLAKINAYGANADLPVEFKNLLDQINANGRANIAIPENKFDIVKDTFRHDNWETSDKDRNKKLPTFKQYLDIVRQEKN